MNETGNAASVELTAADTALLQEYLQAMDEIAQREPERLPAEIWDKVWPEIQTTGQVPAEYRDRIGVNTVTVYSKIDANGKHQHIPEGETRPAYYDIVWESWNAERAQLDSKYHDVIIKALRYALSDGKAGNMQIAELLRRIIETDAADLTPEQVREVLPQLSSIIPQKHLIPNNKLANSLTKDIIDAGAIDLVVSGRGKSEITTRCVLSYEGENVKLSSRQPFTEYDRQVADAVTSLYEYGDESHIVTAATVYRAMIHATETETPSPQQIGAVTRSLDKMRFVRVQIDCSEELTRRKLSLNGAQVTGGKIDTYLLALDKLEVTAGGQKVTAYKVIKTPILYDYSRLTGQVITVPAALLDIRDKNGAKVANTERRIAVKGYLMRRIERMKGKTGNRQSRHILYSDLYENVCEGEPSEKEQRLIREYVGLVLESWKRDKYITGYTELTQGRKKTGVDIKI
ncbi:MAG: hypothetical protein IJH36_02475 [Clostridia bacterium]|nr:hypothetical protein [Clostridia bacterium]